MSKAEARIARKEKKLADSANKQGRLLEKVKSETAPRIIENPESTYHMKVVWTIDQADLLENWSWGVDRQWPEATWKATIEPKLTHFAELTWAEIDIFSSDTGHKMHHTMKTSKIDDEAQTRLWKIERYQDDIFRFRLGNLPRLWGFKMGHEFKVLWYDPTHKIYPVEHD